MVPDFSITFWGTRGSRAVSGAASVQFGGQTPCVEVRAGAESILLDAGTGLAEMGSAVREHGQNRWSLLLSHLHHDHIAGLPFFAPIFSAGTELTVYCGHLNGQSAQTALESVFSPPYFPLALSEAPARLLHRGFVAGADLRIGDVVVRTHSLRHPGGSTAYRLEWGGRTLVYASDVEWTGATDDPSLAAFVTGADLMIFDTMLDEDDLPRCAGWGHSTASAAVRLAKMAGVRRIAGFHHQPEATDDNLARREHAFCASMPGAFFARDGMVLTL